MSLEKLEAFYRGEPQGRLPECAGETIQVLLVFFMIGVPGGNRLLRVEPREDCVAADGSRAEGAATDVSDKATGGNVIDARERFRASGQDRSEGWQPPVEALREIEQSIFGS